MLLLFTSVGVDHRMSEQSVRTHTFRVDLNVEGIGSVRIAASIGHLGPTID